MPKRPWITLAFVALATPAVGASVAPATNEAREYVVQGDRSVGGVVLGRTTAPQAATRFERDGPRRVTRSGSSCVVTWPRLGLTVTFGTLGADPRDACTKGVAFVATVTSRARWRTALGLRVGDETRRLRALYPQAPLHLVEAMQSGYWLVTRRRCAEVGGGLYPGLLARVRGPRVAALVAGVGICE